MPTATSWTVQAAQRQTYTTLAKNVVAWRDDAKTMYPEELGLADEFVNLKEKEAIFGIEDNKVKQEYPGRTYGTKASVELGYELALTYQHWDCMRRESRAFVYTLAT